MKRLFHIVVLLTCTIVAMANDDNIPLSSDETTSIEERRDEYPVDNASPLFRARLMSNCSVHVFSEQIMTFDVEVYDSSGTRLLYIGRTTNGVYHVTSDFSSGFYTIKIRGEFVSCIGHFEID